MNRRTTPPTAAPTHDAPPAQPAPEAGAVRVVFDARNAMCLLFRAARPHLSVDELSWLSIDGSDYAEALAANAAVVADNIGWLVKGDNGDGTNPRVGSFQSNADVPQLLFHLASVFTQIAGLVNVVGEATVELGERGQS